MPGLVTLSFDDCYKETIESVKPILSEYDIKATFNLPTKFIGKKFEGRHVANTDDIKKLVKNRHEIASHSHSHIPLSVGCKDDNIPRFIRSFFGSSNKLNFLRRVRKFIITTSARGSKRKLIGIEKFIEEQRKSKKIIEDKFGINCSSFVFPSGSYNKEAIKILSKSGYTSVRTSDVGYNVIEKLNPYALKVQAWDRCTTAKDGEKWVDKSVKERLWLIECFHLIGKENKKYEYFTPIKEFRKHIIFLAKFQGAKFQVLPQKEVIRLLLDKGEKHGC